MALRESGGRSEIINLVEDENIVATGSPNTSKSNTPGGTNPLGRRDAKLPVIQHLSDKWTERLEKAKFKKNEAMEICQDLEGSPIRGRSFRRLLTPGLWLDGDILSAYLKMVGRWANQEAGKSKVAKFVVHDTYFFDIMERSFYTKSSQPSSKDVQALLKTIEKAGVVRDDILKVDTVLIPINHNGNHWVLGIVRPLRKQVELWDSLAGDEGQWSKDGPWRMYCKIFLRWLKFQCGTNSNVDTKVWTFNPNSSPKQYNSYDCGVYIYITAYCLALNIYPVFRAKDMQQQQRNIAATILNNSFIGEFK